MSGNVPYNIDLLTFIAQRALSQLNHAVDLYAVLRGHLWLERDVLELLQLRNPNESPRRSFNEKIHRAKARGLIEETDFMFLEALNNVRNGFAHKLDRETLTREDDDDLFAASGDAIRTLYARLTVEVEEPETERARGLRFRGLIAAMHIRLLQRISNDRAANKALPWNNW